MEEYAPNELPNREPLATAGRSSIRDHPPRRQEYIHAPHHQRTPKLAAMREEVAVSRYQLPTSVPPHTIPADSYVTYLLSSLCSHLRHPNAFLPPPAAKGTAAMASPSSQHSETPSSPPHTQPREHRTLKRRPFLRTPRLRPGRLAARGRYPARPRHDSASNDDRRSQRAHLGRWWAP